MIYKISVILVNVSKSNDDLNLPDLNKELRSDYEEDTFEEDRSTNSDQSDGTEDDTLTEITQASDNEHSHSSELEIMEMDKENKATIGVEPAKKKRKVDKFENSD